VRVGSTTLSKGCESRGRQTTSVGAATWKSAKTTITRWAGDREDMEKILRSELLEASQPARPGTCLENSEADRGGRELLVPRVRGGS